MADNGQLSTLFSASFSQDPNVRKQAEQQLKEAEGRSGVPSAMLQLIASNDVDANVRQAASIYLKNCICKNWDEADAADGKHAAICTPDRELLKQNIFPVLLHAPSRIRLQLKAAFETIVRVDFPDKWGDLAGHIVGALRQPSSEQTVGALMALGVLLNAQRYKPKEGRQVPNAVIEQTFPLLVHLGSSLLAATPLDQAPESVSLLLHLIFKCYRYTVHQYLSPHQRSQESLVAWGTLFLQVVNRQTPASALDGDPEDRERLEWWKAKKWAYALLNMLFARFGSPSQLTKSTRAEYGSFAETFERSFAPEILKAYMRQVELLISGQIWLSNRCKRHIVDFLTECIKPKSMWLQLKPHLPALIERFLFPLFCLEEGEIEMFTEEPSEFVREHMADSVTEYFRLPVTAAEQFLEQLVEKRKATLMTVLGFVSAVVQKYPQEKTPKEKDAVLRMIASIAQYVVSSKEFGSHLEGFVSQFVVPEFSSPYGFLRARACDVVNKLEAEDMNWENTEALTSMLHACLNLLTDRELPVRVAAALALPELSRYDQVRAILAPNIGIIMQDLLASANEVEIDRLTVATRDLFQSFTEELMPFAVQLSTQLTSTYMRLATEIAAALKEDDADFDENKTLTAMSNLRALEQLLESIEELPDHLAMVESQVLPAINYTLSNDIYTLYDEVFELLDSFLFYQKKVSPAMWQTFEILFSCFKGDGLDYISEMMPVWDNFISYGSQRIIENVQYIEALVSTIETAMNSPRLGAEDRASAMKIAESLLLNLRGSIDAFLPRLLHHAVEFVFRPLDEQEREPVVTEHLYLLSLELLINAIYYNPTVTFQYLGQHNLVGGVLHKWLKDIEKFTRVHDRKLGILAVTAIMEQLQRLPAEVTQAAASLIAATVVLFDGLPAAIKNRQKAEEHMVSTDSDEEGEDEDQAAEDDTGAGADQQNGDEDEDVAGDDIDEELITALIREKLRESNGGTSSGLGEGSDDEEELWEEEVLFTSPLDNTDVYIQFSQLLLVLQREYPAALGQLTAEQQSKMQVVISIATAGGERTFLKKESKSQNGQAATM